MTDHTELNRKVALLAGWIYRSGVDNLGVVHHQPFWCPPPDAKDAWRSYTSPPFTTDPALWAPLLEWLMRKNWNFDTLAHKDGFVVTFDDGIAVEATTLGEVVCLAYIAQREREGK